MDLYCLLCRLLLEFSRYHNNAVDRAKAIGRDGRVFTHSYSNSHMCVRLVKWSNTTGMFDVVHTFTRMFGSDQNSGGGGGGRVEWNPNLLPTGLDAMLLHHGVRTYS